VTARVSTSLMRSALFALAVVACGSPKPAPKDPDPTPGVVKDTRTPIEKRRDAACDKVGDRIVECAVADAKADLDAGKSTKADYDADTKPAITKVLKDKWLKTCTRPKTSHQVRVLEVCLKEEPQCGPFTDCLLHINDELK